ncbi:hypothetical protein FB599_2259 [Herbaspirillum sp. SJZ130]|nr:hypothetical protein [Herbaspirillum sp. SJZ102]TQK06116.1 hypothetical protein FB599_2259 [Herbaspirillum sp. SJZ130]TQK12406.1 hypothetical protein FB598_2361 [Herbaspirillum sp. SJZ106]
MRPIVPLAAAIHGAASGTEGNEDTENGALPSISRTNDKGFA